MNQTFDLHRFRMVLRLDIAEKSKNYSLMGAMLVGLMLLLMLPLLLIKIHNELYVLFHALALFMIVLFGGSLFSAQIFTQYGSAATGISAIMVPASRFEKFLSALLHNLLFIVPLLILFLTVHHKSIEYANSGVDKDQYHYREIPREILNFFVFLYIIIQGVVVLGSIYFRKLAYIKTAITFVITYLIVLGVNMWQAYHFTDYPPKVVTFPFSSWKIWYFSTGQSYFIPFPETFQYVVYSFPIFLLLACWYIAYVRLREKQI